MQTLPNTTIPEARQGSQSPEHSRRSQGTASLSVQSDSDSEDVSVEEPESELFDYATIHPFVKAVKKALQWEEEAREPAAKRRFLKHPKKEGQTFPFMEEVKEMYKDEWAKVEKKPSLTSRFAKLYPFKSEEVGFLENAPTVDAALTRMARHVTLPMEDAVSFRDGLDRRIDADLKRIYLTAGAASKPAIALISVSKALEVWAEFLESATSAEEVQAGDTLKLVKVAANFLTEASVDVVKMLARIMLGATTGRRALWLKPWVADPVSKQNWCRIPFEGQSLFGNKLDTAIARATGGRSGFLPQDRRWSRQKRFIPAIPAHNRLREARSYRPGKEPRRAWKGPRGSVTEGDRPSSFRGRRGARPF